jgi:hypothetical protein
MSLNDDNQQNIQMRLDFSSALTGAARGGAGEETESPMATNEPESPARTNRLMEEVCERENLKEALRQVKGNKGSAGVDGITVGQLTDYLKQHWPAIREQLLNGTYEPKPVRRVEIPKPDGGVRKLGIPTALREIHAALPQTVLEAAIVRGGFPELYATPDIDGTAFYNSYLATYLERDVRSLANVGSLRDFERFLRACALRSANLLNKADLARDIGIAPSTANHWLSTLEAAGQIVLLEPWFSNRTKSFVKSPKLYLADTASFARC